MNKKCKFSLHISSTRTDYSVNLHTQTAQILALIDENLHKCTTCWKVHNQKLGDPCFTDHPISGDEISHKVCIRLNRHPR